MRIVGRILPESVCRLCGYDNPYNDEADYVCRQCRVRADKWGSGKPATPASPAVTPEKKTLDDYKHKFDELVAKSLVSIEWDVDAGDDNCYTYLSGDAYHDLKQDAEKQLTPDECIDLDLYTDNWLSQNDEEALEACHAKHGYPDEDD